ncbi:efflux RND transporter periplasmic adaptor subunit [Synoicihabitans lomoniglobus]|uniref:Efflux RND transporter periplasmic adaptor subunit n=1 Tax=Synoicihabitans lomoniglobus TaxID=2909285 RepID=A0AAF0CNK8_9BACT|nr:efflux RND transporter periplasmic adaptor subunit [Opitutaceae bacterium LMO-M01]WED64535.1 efflux RND transporter periplasmic adaptor subunit [Opitutaceae bacterium LMO-M01]
MTESASPPAPFDPTAGDNHQRRRKGWRYGVGLILIALIVAGLWPAPLPVETSVVTRGPLTVTVNEEGMTQVRHRFVVSSPVSGSLRRIVLKPGAIVEAGRTVLAVLEPAGGDILDVRSRAQAEARVRAAESQVAQAEAQRERAAAALELAGTEASRQRTLAKDRLVSQQELDIAINRERTAAQEDRASTFALQVARYELEQARAVLMRGQPGAEDLDALMTITSPVSGRVLRVLQESARLVTGGTPLIEVGDPTDLEVRIEVLSRDGVAIATGANVWLDQWGGPQPLRAQVRLVEPAAFTKVSALGVEEQRVNVLADLVTPATERPTLGDGYRVEARIERATRENVLQVAAGALFQREKTWSTFVLKGKRATLREVDVGLSDGIMTEITRGLEQGETVIIYPGDRVADGSRVEPIDT